MSRWFAVSVTLLLSLPAVADARESSQATFTRTLDRMMVQLGPESTRASRTIKREYRNHLDLLVLERYASLEGALANGGLAPLPAEPRRFNIAPRLSGYSPIAEKDLDNQISYIAARPATIGALLEVASRVKSGPIEVTSLVRHSEYQGALRATNKNATTSVPMHTMGLAFDIALVNTPLHTAYEIRDVLRTMRDAGDILFIGERQQLVFHVVPHPSRLGYFNDVYARALGAVAPPEGTHVVAFSTPARHDGSPLSPAVTAEVVAVLPTADFADEWWEADHAHSDLSVEVSPSPMAAAAPPVDGVRLRDGFGGEALALFAGILGIAVAVRRMPTLDSGGVRLQAP